jgi:phytoene dehydrogenase-like protein
MHTTDVAVIGGGFGGLGAALTLAEAGATVTLCESLRYPGGCASTFTRQGRRYESGATLFSGFDPGQLFARWIDRHAMDVRTEVLDPVISLRAPGFSLDVPPSREALIARLCALDPARAEGITAFFETQRRVADALWSVLDDPALLPPVTPASLLAHLRRAPRYLPALRWVTHPLRDVLTAHGVEACAPLRLYLDAICQITVQVGVDEAEAPIALSTVDYPFRGTRHVHGGIGRLADAMVSAVRARGGDVRMPDAVQSLRREGDGWLLRTRRGEVRARVVIANLVPRALEALWGERTPWLDANAARVDDGWGAAMLYLTLREDASIPLGARHFELIADPSQAFTDGNHIFVSLGAADEGRCPAGERVATVSTHVSLRTLRELPESARGAHIAAVQRVMRETLRAQLPSLDAAVTGVMTASPRTFARFTGRPEGAVGGVPRRAGWGAYRDLVPPPVAPGLYLVGDSVFPGQSTLATALGGVKTAERALALLGRSARAAVQGAHAEHAEGLGLGRDGLEERGVREHPRELPGIRR